VRGEQTKAVIVRPTTVILPPPLVIWRFPADEPAQNKTEETT